MRRFRKTFIFILFSVFMANSLFAEDDVVIIEEITCLGNIDATTPMLFDDELGDALKNSTLNVETRVHDLYGTEYPMNLSFMRVPGSENSWLLILSVGSDSKWTETANVRVGVGTTDGVMGSVVLYFYREGNLFSVVDSAGTIAADDGSFALTCSFEFVDKKFGPITPQTFHLNLASGDETLTHKSAPTEFYFISEIKARAPIPTDEPEVEETVVEEPVVEKPVPVQKTQVKESAPKKRKVRSKNHAYGFQKSKLHSTEGFWWP